MMLIICDKNPVRAAELVPDRLKFKQLLELCQMLCSVGYSNIYKKIPQGKVIQEWIKRNPAWTKTYGAILYYWCLENNNLKEKTMSDIFNILSSVPEACDMNCEIETAIFRFSKNYNAHTLLNTDCELPAWHAVQEYKKYMEWKNANRK